MATSLLDVTVFRLRASVQACLALAHRVPVPGPDTVADRLHALFRALEDGERAGLPSAYLRAEVDAVRHLVARAPTFYRLQAWPRGYAGDFETIEHLCEGVNRAPPGTLAHALEAYALQTPVVQQHRNKVQRQAELVRAALAGGARVLSIACGPSLDARAVADELPDAGEHLVLNDADPDALAHTRARLGPLARGVTLVQGNVLLRLRELERLGPYTLVLAGGLFDYLSDRAARLLLGFVHERLLAPDGRFFFTNIAAPNPYRVCMEYLADWTLLERTEPGLLRLCVGAGIPSPRLDVTRDATGLTLLAELHAGRDSDADAEGGAAHHGAITPR